ncbi:MAG: thrombospondin type 3 repeat-containing protein, partial [Woeseiaceae bacterium]|nr:thrombospondin type 3 repeat-containing protein [Woeseiaceae bacterium]
EYNRRLDMNSSCHVNIQDFVYFAQQHGQGTPGPSGLPCAGSDEGPCRARLDDQDGDGIGDVDDTCELSWNPDQGDSDGDGIADACDACPNIANPDQDESDCRVFLMSFSSRLAGKNAIDDLMITEDDLVAYDVASQTWTLYFDASDVGFSKGRLDGVAALDDGSLLLSKSSPGSVGGITYDDSDILRFRPYTLGENTTGSFEIYFDGSDAGLETGGEDIDAIAVLSDGNFAISLAGNGRNLPGLETTRVRDEDILIFSSESLGSETVGSFTVLISGNEIGLDTASEDIDALTIDSAGPLTLSVVGRYRVGEILGEDADLLRFTPGEPEPGSFARIFEGAGAGLPRVADIGGVARAAHPWAR